MSTPLLKDNDFDEVNLKEGDLDDTDYNKKKNKNNDNNNNNDNIIPITIIPSSHSKSPSLLSDPQPEQKTKSDINATEVIKKKIAKRKARRRTRPYINLRLRNIQKLFDYEELYFACIAPLRSDHIDLHCSTLEDLDLHYCCGLYMKIDRSFTVHTILSTEFITSLKKRILKRVAITNKKKQMSENKGIVDLKLSKTKSNDDDSKQNWGKYAFHPSDHWEFAKDMEHKYCIIFIHGQNYADDEKKACQYIMNECIAFYADLPYLVIPFIWPCEGGLLDYDANVIAEEYCGAELATMIRRLWSLFERIDFVAHGKGCNILLRALKLLKKDKPDVIDMSHAVLIAADMDYTVFIEEYIEVIYRNIQRITLYVNTWDWKLFSSKIWNWSSHRAGAMLFLNEKHNNSKYRKFDCVDVTNLLSGWFLTSNHYYLTNKFFKNDIIQALSKIGGVDPKFRNYVLPVYHDDQSMNNDALLNNDGVAYYELVDKPYMKTVPETKQNQNINVKDDDDSKQGDLVNSNESSAEKKVGKNVDEQKIDEANGINNDDDNASIDVVVQKDN